MALRIETQEAIKKKELRKKERKKERKRQLRCKEIKKSEFA